MKSKKQNTNRADLYFTQKRWSTIDTVAAVLIAIGAFMFVGMNGGGPLGIPIALVGIIIEIFSSNSKVKESDYDEELNKLINAHYIETHRQINDEYDHIIHKITMCNYDISKAPVIVGKNSKARSKEYCIATFEFREDKCRIELNRINVPEKKVETSNYSLTVPCSNEIVEKQSAVPAKKCYMLHIEGLPEIPIDINDTDVDYITDHLNSQGR